MATIGSCTINRRNYYNGGWSASSTYYGTSGF